MIARTHELGYVTQLDRPMAFCQLTSKREKQAHSGGGPQDAIAPARRSAEAPVNGANKDSAHHDRHKQSLRREADVRCVP
jgi:hypothetical protein